MDREEGRGGREGLKRSSAETGEVSLGVLRVWKGGVGKERGKKEDVTEDKKKCSRCQEHKREDVYGREGKFRLLRWGQEGIGKESIG